MGRKKRPFYRLVVLDSRKRRDGAYLANLGYYNPFNDPHEVDLHEPEILSWLSKGATVSETARALLRAEGVLYKYSLVKQGLDEAEIDSRMGQWRQETETKRQAKLDAHRGQEGRRGRRRGQGQGRSRSQGQGRGRSRRQGRSRGRSGCQG